MQKYYKTKLYWSVLSLLSTDAADDDSEIEDPEDLVQSLESDDEAT
jgi:hypothetical protein